MKGLKRRSLFAAVLAALILAGGCVTIPVPTVEPLTEQVVGGGGRHKVLIIDISGAISDEREALDVLGLKEKPPLTARIREELDKAAADADVKAVVLRINSPGGVVTTCDIINHEIRRFKRERKVPVVAQLMDVAASGGYYVAVAADAVVAHPTTVTGSIGVVAYMVNASGLLGKVGITDETIKSGGMKDLGSPLRPMTDEDRRVLQGIIDSLYERFIEVVDRGRPELDRETIRKLADGRIYTAGQALEHGLIDEIGYLERAVEIAKKRAGIEQALLVTYTRPGAYRANIYSGVPAAGPTTVNLINIDARALTAHLGVKFMYLWMP
ncbi:MAG TPA: signal peptide peptidase SppA [Deltaproteobacteria bacterium]|nr:signal peptide peptidase SppA [Deltaproteobacteria bacterium]